jgi:DNA-binding MarR family transcriptional regulator/N-acetylglutamate synthase-like GNAT family acetyltransferase
MSVEADDESVATVRAFSRFYTNVIGVLREGLLESPYSLSEARVIFELAQADRTELAALRRTLTIDAGYLSRIISRLESDGIAAKERSSEDGRRQLIRLTRQGRTVFNRLDERSTAEVRALLSPLPERDRRRLVGAMDSIRAILGDSPRREALVLRAPGPGDLGWVVELHGSVYADEYGWDQSFEALVASIVADYSARSDHPHESAWIAEVDGERVGCAFCVKRNKAVAQLRLLLVAPSARGMGIGSRLVEECIRFARRARYRQMMLWTNDVLEDARRIYERAGFELREEESHTSFGHELVGQNWWLEL